MGSSELALLGGLPVNQEAWPATNTIGSEEKQAVIDVLDSGILSGYRAVSGPEFMGGSRVRGLEEAWADAFGVKHAVAVNSLSSGLLAAVGALGLGPGDEVIVPPFTMSASATCAIAYGAVPVFADIDPNSYCLAPDSVRENLSPRTKLIVAVHLFGHPADMDALRKIAEERGISLLEDCAQAPGGETRGRSVGTVGNIGGFSLNYHKTIHSGEGGVMVTDDDELALRMCLIRNHGEVVVEGAGVSRLENTFGGNYRMTEMEAAVATAQLAKLDWLVDERVRLAQYLDQRLEGFPGVTAPKALQPGDRHVYYFYPMRFHEEAWGLSRETFVRAIRAEGVPLRQAYVRPVYWEPMYQRRVGFANGGFPLGGAQSQPSYARGLCPVTEEAHMKSLIFGKFCRWPLKESHMDQVIQAFEKVYEGRRVLAEAAA